MKVIGAVMIGKLIEAHYEKDEHKFKLIITDQEIKEND